MQNYNGVPSEESFPVFNYLEPPVSSQYSPQHFAIQTSSTLHKQLNTVGAWTGVAISAPTSLLIILYHVDLLRKTARY